MTPDHCSLEGLQVIRDLLLTRIRVDAQTFRNLGQPFEATINEALIRYVESLPE